MLAGESHPTSPASRGPDQKGTLSADTSLPAGNSESRHPRSGSTWSCPQPSLLSPKPAPCRRATRGQKAQLLCPQTAPRQCWEGKTGREAERDCDPERNTLKDPEKGRQRKAKKLGGEKRNERRERPWRAPRGRHIVGSKVIRMGNSDSSESHLPQPNTAHTSSFTLKTTR